MTKNWKGATLAAFIGLALITGCTKDDQVETKTGEQPEIKAKLSTDVVVEQGILHFPTFEDFAQTMEALN
jgi:hypothetical protein